MRKSGEEENPASTIFHEGNAMHPRFWKLILPFYAVLELATIFNSVQCRSPSATSVASLFVIGDSSVNCGSNVFFTHILGENSSLFLCNGTAQRLVPDIIAKKMGLLSAPPFYGQNQTLEGLLRGLNFGSSTATVMNWGAATFQNLNSQLRQASETFQLLQMKLGLEMARSVVQSSLFYISIGKDDFIEYLRDLNGVARRHAPQAFARMLANQVVRAVKDLYNANVKTIICAGVEPLGCAPRSLWHAYNSTSARAQSACVDDVNRMVTDYNAMVSADLLSLNPKMPDANIVFCDTYRGIMEMIRNPKSYGFKVVDSACCGVGRFGGMVGCVTTSMACRERSSHVWWDLYNPTEATNSFLAEWMWSGSPIQVCRPSSVGQMTSTSAGAPGTS